MIKNINEMMSKETTEDYRRERERGRETLEITRKTVEEKEREER